MKRWRVYFNRAQDAPQIDFHVTFTAEARSASLPIGTTTDPKQTPFAWLDVFASTMQIENGVAVFS